MGKIAVVVLSEEDGKKNLVSYIDKKKNRVLLVNLKEDYVIDENAEVDTPKFIMKIMELEKSGKLRDIGAEIEVTLEDLLMIIKSIESALNAEMIRFYNISNGIANMKGEEAVTTRAEEPPRTLYA